MQKRKLGGIGRHRGWPVNTSDTMGTQRYWIHGNALTV
jgi:hypothetical protein